MDRMKLLEHKIKKLEEIENLKECDNRTILNEYRTCIEVLKSHKTGTGSKENDFYFEEIKRGFLECLISSSHPHGFYSELNSLKEEWNMLICG